MLPVYKYKETYTFFETPSKNTKIHIYKKKKILSERKKENIKIKILSLCLIAVGIITIVVIPEDNGGGLIALVMGIGGILNDI